ncbi:hypothetical protein [Ruminococcus flavefaciens]|uniref:hypothetical protein n=3 Tax=Ruminococcus TaxID=1263 RepID=UPI000466D524|nr:hypothetical protein [Ruminococcus flavefaciens]
MPVERMLPQQQQHPPEVIQADTPKGAKVFGITRFGFKSFDELIHKSAQEYGVEFDLFFSNSLGTQHGWMKVFNGKVTKTIPLLEISVSYSQQVIQAGTKIGYIIKYYHTTMSDTTEDFISYVLFDKHKVSERLNVPPQGSKSKDELCEKLVETLIIEKAEEAEPIEVGAKQGWCLVSEISVFWESRMKYPTVLQKMIPESIAGRETPKIRKALFKKEHGWDRAFNEIFNTWPDLKVPFLIRESSYMLTFVGEYGVSFNQIINFKTTDMADSSLWAAMFDNVSYGHGSVLSLSRAKNIEHASRLLNDAVLLVVDDTKADESKKREEAIDVLQRRALNSNSGFCQIPVIVSDYAFAQMRPDLCIDFSGYDGNYDISQAVLTEVLESHDAKLIERIQKEFCEFIEIFNANIEEVSKKTPYMIPAQRRNAYYILVAALRTYDEYFGVFFDEGTESRLVDILSTYNEVGSSNDELLLTLLGNCLNEEISSGRFNFIKRTKFIVINQGNNSVIVDDDYVYFDTDIIGELARSKLKLNSVNTLTDAIKASDCLNINDHNSKCYRFHVQNSDGESYMLYTYGVSKKLINAENRKRLELADYQKFLLDYSELGQNELLPLGITADGRYVGKDISFGNKSNDHIFITGQSGKGKSFCATNLLPLLAMLGSRMLVCDVSDSFTRDEVIRALPPEVVDALFEFIEVADGKRKIPVNLLLIGDCSGLPARKRRIVSFIKAIAGKLDKDETRSLTGVISDMLKRYPNITSVSTEMLRNALKRGGKVGNHVFSLISSTLDDIDKIGFEEQGWAEFFEKTKKIPVLYLGNESGDKEHSLLDALIASAFEWQRDHDTAPLSIVVDEIKDQCFAEGSPLHTILTQGRKFNTKFIGMTTEYISIGSRAIDVVKEAGIKIFFRPAKSLERIAVELGYKNAANAGFGSMGIGDIILCAELYNKIDGVNEPIVIHAKAIKFIDTPLYGKFQKEYGIK